jgi:ankyrin repeat protein
LAQGERSRAISLATKFIKQYPDGKFAVILKKWIERSLESTGRSNEERQKRIEGLESTRRPNEERQQAAEKYGLTILLEETTSGKNRLLESLLNDLIDGQTDSNIRIADGKTAFMLAAANGHVESVKALIQKGAEVNAKEYRHGWTALVYAIWNGNIDTVQILLNNGTDPKKRDKENRTPLEHARISGYVDIIELLERATAK